ncbi:MAG: hypothetical protein KF889_24880 [Alphaproteobacteria bacterium]|nr:hypothetical protein [Alphaproteobacteria bacterium]MCW5742694.1 hypothetical protein [Alphaproteobacteria bacterium]
MSRNATIAVVIGAIVVAVLGGWLAVRLLGGVSEAEYARNFTKGCEDSARQALVKDGKPAQEAQATAQAYCACALGIVAPMSVADKRELEKGGGPRAQQIAAEVRTKCLK